jgi:hypothetical protein
MDIRVVNDKMEHMEGWQESCYMYYNLDRPVLLLELLKCLTYWESFSIVF